MGKEHILGEVYKVVADNNRHLQQLWIGHIIFTWRWWLGVALTIIPWIIWIKARNKKETIRLLFTGLVVAIVTNVLDLIGICYGLWYYDYKVTPMTVIYVPWDFALFPVAIMLLLQLKPKVNVFIKAIGFAMICAFVFEPLFAWLDIYVYVKWKHWYSFIIYIPLYLIFNKIYNSKLLKQ
ncbi:CBO0543 family protein [Clostridium folliculivorans]|uniref:CBO0543 family protein n=1 Tax=Clostridium folliculivorans TaxID=2886038 RepID=UPI0021C3B866|nr:CBO0543 family protein [Clostridium folliculivorans]